MGPFLLTSTASTNDVASPSVPLSESEDDTYGGQRGRTFAKKHRQKLQAVASGRDTPNLSEVRFSTRRAAKVATYNEDDDLGLSEEDTENMTPNYWTYVEDNTPAIDQVLNHRPKEGTGEHDPLQRARPHLLMSGSRSRLCFQRRL